MPSCPPAHAQVPLVEAKGLLRGLGRAGGATGLQACYMCHCVYTIQCKRTPYTLHSTHFRPYADIPCTPKPCHAAM